MSVEVTTGARAGSVYEYTATSDGTKLTFAKPGGAGPDGLETLEKIVEDFSDWYANLP